MQNLLRGKFGRALINLRRVLERIEHSSGLVYYVSPLLSQANVRHAFTTRIGGVSSPPFDSLNLGNSPGNFQDTAENMKINHQRIQSAIGTADRRRRWVTQVHGNIVRGTQGCFVDGMDGDAMVSSDRNDLLTIRIADCAPILLATTDGRAVAAIHAGWRGVIAGIIPAAVDQLAVHAGVSLNQIIAAIGPCIGFDAFEVGPEVWSVFEFQFGRDVVRHESKGGKGYVDLREAIKRQLVAASIATDRIDITDRCTFADCDMFFSHRRDHGVSGRMAAMISPRSFQWR
ncbi:MAG: peptidoglycan editing factor PgeF [Phycisphaerae bacterium]|nr:peptidoglycan editing factor PgeF [Phycisphaerae bacterium]